ncbi:hypothetical protein BS78_05G059000 [Paspalum vaginatum]|nr:hypothetical protein BS78_05G059000 [Paspalum vaginatum]
MTLFSLKKAIMVRVLSRSHSLGHRNSTWRAPSILSLKNNIGDYSLQQPRKGSYGHLAMFLEWHPAFGNVPGVAPVLPSFVVKVKTSKNKFLSAHVAASASATAKGKWNLSFSLFWNTLVWLMAINFIIQIVSSTA